MASSHNQEDRQKDERAYASVLGGSDIDAIWSVCKKVCKDSSDQIHMLGQFIGAYCHVIKADKETFHDTVLMAAYALHAFGSANREVYLTPHRLLGDEDKKDYAGGLLRNSETLKSYGLSAEAKELLKVFKHNVLSIYSELLGGACEEYANSAPLTFKNAYGGSNTTIWGIFRNLQQNNSTIVIDHLKALAGETLAGAQDYQHWQLSSHRFIREKEQAFVPGISN